MRVSVRVRAYVRMRDGVYACVCMCVRVCLQERIPPEAMSTVLHPLRASPNTQISLISRRMAY